MQLIYINRKLSICLYCVGVEQDTMLMSNLTDLFDRLNGTNLIVCKHHTDQNGSRTDSFFQLIQLDLTKLIHIYISDLKSMFLQPVTSMQDCMMLDLRCNNVISFGSISFCSCF